MFVLYHLLFVVFKNHYNLLVVGSKLYPVRLLKGLDLHWERQYTQLSLTASSVSRLCSKEASTAEPKNGGE